jgi:hypothetical protein
VEKAEAAIHYVAPVGEKQAYVERTMAIVRPFLQECTSVKAA